MLITKKELVHTALTLIKKGATLNWNIDKDVISLYAYALKAYPDDDILSVCKELAVSWKNRFPPQPAVIKDLCQLKSQSDEALQRKLKEEESYEHKAWMSRKYRHRHALKDITDRMRSADPTKLLTDRQKEAIREISRYMIILWDYNWASSLDYKDERHELDPLTASFVGLYMDFLEGRFKPLTGRKQGNLNADPNRMELPKQKETLS